MRRISILKAHGLLVLLIAAHLGGIAHAAEFGAGEHFHDGVACSFGLHSDDDHSLVPPAPVTLAPTDVDEAFASSVRSVNARIDGLLPPATGPPKTHQ